MISACRVGAFLGVLFLVDLGRVVNAAEPAGSFTLRADWFDRGNVRISTPGQDYADKYPCIWNAGQLPNQAEYDLDFPVAADYTLVALYAAADSRPVDIYLDGTKRHRGFASVTGSWQTSHARWERQCTVHVTQGKHTLGRDEEEGFVFGFALARCQLCQVHGFTFPFEGALPWAPDRAHSLAQVHVQEIRELARPIEAVATEFPLDLACIDHQLEQLEGDAFAGSLGADEHRQVAER